ncbi:hypothetical protein DY000_02009720 [Brassica cretica]|uniref:DUF4005 domain-containing protein n=1 Tax=Brassica cretica TaxID=69181 RepID=A0ABQ7CHX2_BRACR|nr:hypothetical protein DY000_02009720 [Brassica cretica]
MTSGRKFSGNIRDHVPPDSSAEAVRRPGPGYHSVKGPLRTNQKIEEDASVDPIRLMEKQAVKKRDSWTAGGGLNSLHRPQRRRDRCFPIDKEAGHTPHNLPASA